MRISGAAAVGRLCRISSHRAPKAAAAPLHPLERTVTAALVMAVIAALAWIGGMIYTVISW
ncbi:morphogenic membrane protein MmpA [Streptomyces sp. NPDC002577]